jgi:hypothetical protein
MFAALRRWRDEIGDTYVLGGVRIVLGFLLFTNAVRALRELQDGYFGDVFHWPMVPEAWVPSRTNYVLIVGLQLILSALVVAGYRARSALFASAVLLAYVMACDRAQFHNNRVALAYYAFLLSFAPCDRSFLVGRPSPPATRVAPLWAARVAQAQVSIVYLASGGSKLFDPDWRSGRVIFERFVLFGQTAVENNVPATAVRWMTQPEVGSVLAKLAIATELLLAVGLWLRGSRIVALWWGVWFHLTIEATSRVEGFTWMTLAMYALFVTPEVRTRALYYDRSRPLGRALARSVTLLDWFARFEVKQSAPGDLERGQAIAVVRRDGTRVTGIAAAATIARCVPALFPLWAPLQLCAPYPRPPPSCHSPR